MGNTLSMSHFGYFHFETKRITRSSEVVNNRSRYLLTVPTVSRSHCPHGLKKKRPPLAVSCAPKEHTPNKKTKKIYYLNVCGRAWYSVLNVAGNNFKNTL